MRADVVIYCPKCGIETQVIETRQSQGNARRRRICKSTSCSVKFTTLEMIISSRDPGLIVVPRRKLEAVQNLLSALVRPVPARESD